MPGTGQDDISVVDLKRAPAATSAISRRVARDGFRTTPCNPLPETQTPHPPEEQITSGKYQYILGGISILIIIIIMIVIITYIYILGGICIVIVMIVITGISIITVVISISSSVSISISISISIRGGCGVDNQGEGTRIRSPEADSVRHLAALAYGTTQKAALLHQNTRPSCA